MTGLLKLTNNLRFHCCSSRTPLSESILSQLNFRRMLVPFYSHPIDPQIFSDEKFFPWIFFSNYFSVSISSRRSGFDLRQVHMRVQRTKWHYDWLLKVLQSSPVSVISSIYIYHQRYNLGVSVIKQNTYIFSFNLALHTTILRMKMMRKY
jgi:hypothetical protein